jgi:hypothetical protein
VKTFSILIVDTSGGMLKDAGSAKVSFGILLFLTNLIKYKAPTWKAGIS